MLHISNSLKRSNSFLSADQCTLSSCQTHIYSFLYTKPSDSLRPHPTRPASQPQTASLPRGVVEGEEWSHTGRRLDESGRPVETVSTCCGNSPAGWKFSPATGWWWTRQGAARSSNSLKASLPPCTSGSLYLLSGDNQEPRSLPGLAKRRITEEGVKWRRRRPDGGAKEIDVTEGR